jgi:hypothetical protein
MIKLTQLLKEIKILQPGTIIRSNEDIKALDILTELFGEGVSDFDLYNPISQTYYYEDYSDIPNDPIALAFKQLLNKYNGTTYLVYPSAEYFKCPGAPPNSYYELIIIDHSENSIEVKMPHVDNDGSYFVGWFDSKKQYHPDTNNFDEDGDYIGNNN